MDRVVADEVLLSIALSADEWSYVMWSSFQIWKIVVCCQPGFTFFYISSFWQLFSLYILIGIPTIPLLGLLASLTFPRIGVPTTKHFFGQMIPLYR
jgi:hypothetical protein